MSALPLETCPCETGESGSDFAFTPPETPCLECMFPDLDDRHLPNCNTRGVLGATTGIIGTMQAMEAIKILAGIGDPLKGKLMICDFKDMSFTKIDIFQRPDCQACQGKIAKPLKERLVWLCGQKTANINPPKPIDLELDDVNNRLEHHFKVLIKSSIVIVFEYNGGIEVSLFKPGRMLIKNVEDEENALEVYKDIINKLGVQIPLD